MQEKIIAAELQKIQENKLTREFIIPLLDAMGFHNITHSGGPSEEGKDIIFWDRDKLGEIKLYESQVKRFKFSAKASDDKGLQTIINQLINCFRREIIYTDKSHHFPTEVWLITPFEIDTKTLQSVFGTYTYLKDQQIIIIDGIKLSKLLIQHKPDLVKSLLGIRADINSKISPTLNNKVLLTAIGFHENKDLKSIYTDIDFSIGKLTTKLFFKSGYKPVKKKVKIVRKDVELFRELVDSIAKEYGADFLPKNLDYLESESKKVNAILIKWRQQKTQLIERRKEMNDELNSLNNRYEELFEQKEAYIDKYGPENLLANDPVYSGLLAQISQNYDRQGMLQRSRIKLNEEISGLEKNEPDYTFEIPMDGKLLTGPLVAHRTWIENKVKEFNTSNPSLEQLRAFIEKSQSILDATSVIFAHPQYFGCIGQEEGKRIRKNYETTRLKFPIDKIFDTGLNFLVLGDAGAGKTTSLQMYTAHRAKESQKFYFWVPLARLVQNWLSKGEITNDSAQRELEIGLWKYLDAIGVTVSEAEFSSWLGQNQIVLLLDGIDEAIKSAPWLTIAITNLSKKHENRLQIIVTSRMSGSYINDIPFFSLTLLPFTDSQRDEFISKWFKEEPDDTIVNRIRKHFASNTDISEIVRNPLLTTTLCVLAKYRLPLPNTEITLYNERLKLLTGYYDSVKNIAARISVTPQVLEILAQKIAYQMHIENVREKDIEEIIAFMKKAMANQMPPDVVDRAIRELYDPCNLMVPMTEDGKYGFDHLRYQEHLAAKEIISNRSINIYPLLKQPWWAGVLVLFARMNSDLTWLIQDIGKDGKVSLFAGIIKDMVRARPAIEQTQLNSLIERFMALDLDTSALKTDVFMNFDEDDYVD